MQIEHNPREPNIDRTNFVFWVSWAIVGLMWICLWIGGHQFDWVSVGAGAYTMAVLVITNSEKRHPPAERTPQKVAWRDDQ